MGRIAAEFGDATAIGGSEDAAANAAVGAEGFEFFGHRGVEVHEEFVLKRDFFFPFVGIDALDFFEIFLTVP